MDTATSRSMTAVVISRAVAESSAVCAQTSSFHAVPSASKLRHSARSRGIHLRVAKASAREASAPALHYGYCDFAQYDDRRHFKGSCGSSAVCAQTPPFRAAPSASKPRHSTQCPLHPNFVIPRAVAESISALPRHQPERPAPPALHYGYCDFAQYDGRRHFKGSCGIQRRLRPNPAISRSALCIQTSSFRAQSRNPSPRCQGISQRGQRPLHSTMDTATSRSMTAVVIPMAVAESSAVCAQTSSFHAVSSAYKLRHSARSRGIHLRVAKASAREASAPALHYGYCDFAQYDGRRHFKGSCGIQRRLRPNPAIPRSVLCIQTSSFRAQSRNPSPRCQGISQRGQRPCTPLWILRLRAV